MAKRPLLEQLPTPVRVLLVFAALYMFLVGIGAMSTGFKMMGTDFTEGLLGSRTGPFVSLMIGIFATSLIQSSSTSSSILVGLVAGGFPLQSAIYMVMGANVGTTVTNTIVSLGHITRSEEYRRAFAAATVHDFFNGIVLCVLFPLEVMTGGLHWLAGHVTEAFQDVGGFKLASPIKIVTKPAIHLIQDGVAAIGGGGTLVIILGILLTFGMLFCLVKVLRSIMVAKLENLFDRLLFKSPYRALVFGLFFTILVQSSSITTSLAVPLVGAGIITIRQVMPYTMGANIGTTITAVLASLGVLAATDPGNEEDLRRAMAGVQLAFVLVLFNVLGVILVWPFRWIPVKIAEAFSRLAVWNRLIPLVYIILTFFVVPGLIVWFWR